MACTDFDAVGSNNSLARVMFIGLIEIKTRVHAILGQRRINLCYALQLLNVQKCVM